MKTRRLTGFAALAFLSGLLILDRWVSQPLNPYQAPPIVAYGSGLASGGAHCAAMPSAN
jgi:hypothetical protein